MQRPAVSDSRNLRILNVHDDMWWLQIGPVLLVAWWLLPLVWILIWKAVSCPLFRKHALNCHRMKPALFNVLCEIKEKTGKLCFTVSFVCWILFFLLLLLLAFTHRTDERIQNLVLGNLWIFLNWPKTGCGHPDVLPVSHCTFLYFFSLRIYNTFSSLTNVTQHACEPLWPLKRCCHWTGVFSCRHLGLSGAGLSPPLSLVSCFPWPSSMVFAKWAVLHAEAGQRDFSVYVCNAGQSHEKECVNY